MSKDENLHAGHRQRMRREMIEQNSFDQMGDHRILEVLLFYGIPRKDTNPIAHELLNKFGSLTGVMDAEFEELKAVKGMTENAATLIKTIMPIARRYNFGKFKVGHNFKNIDEIGHFLIAKYIGRKNEVFAITSLDTKARLLGFDIIGEGTPDTVEISLRDIAQTVIKRNASCVIISHNHVDAFALPSISDIEMTVSIQRMLAGLGTNLLDDIIIAGDDYISMKQTEKYSEIFK